MTDLTTLPRSRAEPINSARWRERWGKLFRGTGYAFAVLGVLWVGWMLQALLDLSSIRDLSARQSHVVGTFWMVAKAALPTAFVMVILVNLAPQHGMARIAWLVAVGIVVAIWAQSVAGAGMPRQLWWACLAEASIWTTAVMAVYVFHRDVRDASGQLLRVAIDRTATETALKRRELGLLRAQLEPHFLFNTLSAVRSLGQTDRPATVVMLRHLETYFEAGLPQLRRDETTIASELALVDAYLAIFKVRLGARLQYQIDLPEAVAQQVIPSMIILTLVENGLKHGIAPAVAGGSIAVTVKRDAGRLVCEVADSGGGMDARMGQGMGLANVRQRLLMRYGAAGELTLAPGVPRGVVATLRVPIAKGPG